MAHSLQRWACAVLDCVQFHLIDQRYQRHVLELYGDAPAPLRWQQVTGAVDLWDQQGASPSPTLPLPDLFCWMCRCLLPMGSTRSCASSPTSRLRPRPAQRMTCSHIYCRCSIQVQERPTSTPNCLRPSSKIFPNPHRDHRLCPPAARCIDVDESCRILQKNTPHTSFDFGALDQLHAANCCRSVAFCLQQPERFSGYRLCYSAAQGNG